MMTWQKAVAESKVGRAMRLTDRGQVVQAEFDGTAYVVVGSAIRIADASECQGFEDWQPMQARNESVRADVGFTTFSAIGLIDQARRKIVEAHAGDANEAAVAWIGLLEGIAMKAASMANNLRMSGVSDQAVLAHVRRQAADVMTMIEDGLPKGPR